MCDSDGSNSNYFVFECDNGNLGDAFCLWRKEDLDSPDESSWVRHVGIERHDVEVVGVTGENVLQQVRGTGVWQLRMDRRLAMEGSVAGRQHLGSPRPVDTNGRQWTMVAHADAPWIKQHAGQITGMVGMEVREVHGFQTAEVETGVDEGGRRSATAVDDKDSSVDDERGRSAPAAGDG